VSTRDEDLLARVPVISFSGAAYRQQSPTFDPRSGAGARRMGGRFNPPNSFPVLYLGLSVETVAAELHRAAAAMGLPTDAVLPRELFRYDIELVAVVDLRGEGVLDTLGTTREELLSADRARGQSLGAAAARMGAQALICPSATGVGDVLAVFVDNLGSGRCEPQLLETWETRHNVPEIA
jgi:RES domain-containing protein